MRKFLLGSAVAISLAACSPPASQKAETPPLAPPPGVAACNDVTPDASQLVELRAQTVAAASLPPELRGGPITPGVYDLESGVIMSVSAQPATLTAALQVTESADGVQFDWVEIAAGSETRWTAGFQEGPPARLTFSCGRDGASDITFGVEGDNLTMRWPDPTRGGNVELVLSRRA